MSKNSLTVLGLSDIPGIDPYVVEGKAEVGEV